MIRRKGEEGQATVLVLLAMGIFLIGAVGLATDGSHLFAQRQMAQAAADAAAQAGIMSIFNGTNGGSAATSFGTGSAFTCSTTDTKTPCAYARLNGFGGTASDTVTVDFPTSAPGVNLSDSDAVNLLRVTVQRNVNTTLMRFLGTSVSTIKATATAAIVNVVSPTPIVVTDPSGSNTLSMNGTTAITITGGPNRSIQINSKNSSAYTGGGNIDLSKAGPNGTGADFGVFGGNTTNPGSVSLGTTGHYVQPASPIQDPLAQVFPNGPPAPTSAGTQTSVNGPVDGCPTGSKCTVYSPGLWPAINVKNDTAIFKPGLYYIRGGGFTLKNSTVSMCPATSCAADPDTGMGMVIYDTGTTSNPTATGGFNIDTNVTATLLGAGISDATLPTAPSAPYYGILFFEDRKAQSQTHTLGQGNGCFSLVGTIYITNSLDVMTRSSNPYFQTVNYHGTPCSSTANQGEIIVSDLVLKGTSQINMGLYPTGFLNVRQVALVQ